MENEKNKKRTWLWVLGWLFIFPLPLALVLRNKEKIPMVVRLGIITFAALFYTAFVKAYNNVRDEERQKDKITQQEEVQEETPLADAGSSSDEKSTVPETDKQTAEKDPGSDSIEEEEIDAQKETKSDADILSGLLKEADGFTLQKVTDGAAYDLEASLEVNGNVPYFGSDAIPQEGGYLLSDMDALGRCGPAVALVGQETMPAGERGKIGDVKPSGWQTVKYDFLEDLYLYNRCHLLGFQLTGLNAEEKNLITGTRYMNVQGMEPYENRIADYVNLSGNHVLYRVTPLYGEDNLLASGVLLEAMSAEDRGKGLEFAVFCFNVQPGVTIDYATGDSTPDGTFVAVAGSETGEAPGNRALQSEEGEAPTENVPEAVTEEVTEPVTEAITERVTEAPAEEVKTYTYILNTNTKKFHWPSCSSVNDMKEKNKREYIGTREEVINMGYVPCKRCNP